MEDNYLDGLIIPQRQDINFVELRPRVYDVLSGDNLYDIAGGDLDFARSIAYENRLPDPNFIKVGQRLVIPSTTSHDGDLGYYDYILNIYNPKIAGFMQRKNEVSSNVAVNNGTDGSKDDHATYNGAPLDLNGFVYGMYKPELWDKLSDSRKALIIFSGNKGDKVSPVTLDNIVIGWKSGRKNQPVDNNMEYGQHDYSTYVTGDDASRNEDVRYVSNLIRRNNDSYEGEFVFPLYGIANYMKYKYNNSDNVDSRRAYGTEYLNSVTVPNDDVQDMIHGVSDDDLRYYQDNVTNKGVLRAINQEINKRDYNPNGLDNKQKLYKDMFGFGDDVAFTYGSDGSVIAIDGDNRIVDLNGDPKTAYKEVAKDIMRSGGVDEEIVNSTMKIIDGTNDHNIYNDVVGFNMELNDLLKSEGYSKQDRNNMIKMGDIIQKIHNMSYKNYYDAESDMHFLLHFGSAGRLLQEYIVESLPKQVVRSEFLGKIPFVVDPSTEMYSQDALKLSDKYLGDDYTKNIFDNRLNQTMNAVGTAIFDIGNIMADLITADLSVGMVLGALGAAKESLEQSSKTFRLMGEAFDAARLWKNSGVLRLTAFGAVDATLLYNVIHEALDYSNEKFNNSNYSEEDIDKMSALLSLGIGSMHNIKSINGARQVFSALKTKKGFDKVEQFFFDNKRRFNEVLADKMSRYIGGTGSHNINLIALEAGAITPEVYSYLKYDKSLYEHLKDDKDWNELEAMTASLFAGIGSSAIAKGLVNTVKGGVRLLGLKAYEITGGTEKGLNVAKKNAFDGPDSFFNNDLGLKYFGLRDKTNNGRYGWLKGSEIDLDYVPSGQGKNGDNKSLRQMIFDKAKEQFPNMSDQEINQRINTTVQKMKIDMIGARRKAKFAWWTKRNPYTMVFIDREGQFVRDAEFNRGIKALKTTDLMYNESDIDKKFGKTIESVILNDEKPFASTKWGLLLESKGIRSFHNDRLYDGRSAKLVFYGNPEALKYDYKYVLPDGKEVDLFVDGNLNPIVKNSISDKNHVGSGNAKLGTTPLKNNKGENIIVLHNVRGHFDLPIVHYDENGNRQELKLILDVAGMGSGGDKSGILAIKDNMVKAVNKFDGDKVDEYTKGRLERFIKKLKDPNTAVELIEKEIDNLYDVNEATKKEMKKAIKSYYKKTMIKRTFVDKPLRSVELYILDKTPKQQIVTMSINKRNSGPAMYDIWDKSAVSFTKSDVELEIPKEFDDLIKINKDLSRFELLSNNSNEIKLNIDGNGFKLTK